ncbi:ead/Ea22-like family protein [Pseudomonas sp. RIT-To-2]|uniref:ead/Ea22-like family protein n=1 Tax=Pseudomonas sp. RIT-To-2 TaxID=3462541 RepID=UPI0024137B02
MTDYTELKRLAEAATPGPWQTEQAYPIVQPAYPARGSIASALIWQDAHFIAAANPAAILALIAENERLAAQVRLAGVAAEMAVHDAVGRAATDYLLAVHELDQLKAEVEALRKDAARYHWLRDKSESVHQFYMSTPIWFTGVKFSKENVDNTIDAAMSKEAGQ